MTQTLVQAILDHSGAYYGWWQTVTPHEDGTITLAVVEEYAEDDFRAEATITENELREAIKALVVFDDTYEDNFYIDMLRGTYDDADGDMNAVDSILQRALFGEVIFG